MIKFVIACFVLLISVSADAASYYVAQTAAGTGTGLTYEDRASIATFNAGTGVFADISGDTIYFSGHLTTPIFREGLGSPTSTATLDGYETNDTTDVAGGADTSGFAYYSGVDSPIIISGWGNVIIQDFRFVNWSGDSQGGAICINTTDDTPITIKRVHMHDGSSTAHRGLRVAYADNVFIEDSKITNVPSSSSIGIGASFQNADNIGVKRCYFSGCVDSVQFSNYSTNFIVENCSFIDKEQTLSEDHIDIKYQNTGYGVIRYNKFYDTTIRGYSGIQVQMGADNIAIYCNDFYTYTYGVYINGGVSGSGTTTNVHVWGNLFRNGRAGIRSANGTYVTIGTYYNYNNLFYGNIGGSSTTELAAWTPRNGTAIGRNNIYLGNITRYSYPRHIYVQNSTQAANVTSSNNIGYNSDATAQVYWATSAINFESHGTSNTRSNPLLSETFRPTSSSTAILNQGATLSDSTLPDYANRWTIGGETFCNNVGGTCDNLLSYDIGIDPDTDWTTNPPTVVTALHSDYDAVDLGPYVGIIDSDPPVEPPPTPIPGDSWLNGLTAAEVNFGILNPWINGTGGGFPSLSVIDSVSYTTGATETAISITHGLTISEGDLLLAFVSANGTASVTDNNGTNAFIEAAEGASAPASGGNRAIYRRAAGASEPSSYAWTLGSSVTWRITIVQFRASVGSVASDPFDVAPATAMTTGTSANPDTGAITILNRNSLSIAITTIDSASGTISASPSGYTEIITVDGANIRPIAIYYKEVDQGSEDPSQWTLNASNDWGCEVFSLLPSAP